MTVFGDYIQGDALESIARGEQGDAAYHSLELLVGLARAFHAPHLIPVSSVQISGVSFWNLGLEGLEYLETLAIDGRVRVPATLNPAAFNPKAPPAGVSHSDVENQARVVAAYGAMGVDTTLTCAPYLWGNLPRFHSHIAWSESSAVVFANSVIGAMTNREGGPAALAAALTGYAPYYGLHLMENRAPHIVVHVHTALSGALEFGLLGAAIGQRTREIPFIILAGGQSEPLTEDLQALGAALITFGGAPMFHMESITPESLHFPVPTRTLEVTAGDLAAVHESLSSPGEKPQLVLLGCPHYGPSKMAALSRLPLDIEGLSIGTAASCNTLSCGGLRGGCAAVAPLPSGVNRIATNSVKAAFYLKNRGVSIELLSEAQCLALGNRSEEP
ncbi:aconitase X catalytic domain-containing protein [Myxococcota bacterium]|nr:aconitase X catalytic domain-containing protein [Myxococcota bacterium]